MSKKTNEKIIIGTYPISNTLSICVYDVDYTCDRILVSDGVAESEWCFMDEKVIESGECMHGSWSAYSHLWRFNFAGNLLCKW